jgi:hypothetical protein
MAAAILDAMRVGEGTAATSPAAGALLRLQQEPAGGRFHTAVIDLLRGTVVRRVQVLTLGGIVAYSSYYKGSQPACRLRLIAPTAVIVSRMRRSSSAVRAASSGLALSPAEAGSGRGTLDASPLARCSSSAGT